jgi:(1->4)-alpha-D-glucan 1-alpha-D-glucosylmutase
MKSLRPASITELARRWHDGRIKQAVIARALAVRRAAPRLFAEGEYLPLEARGPLADHVVAFARRLDDSVAIIAVCRLPVRLLDATDGLCSATQIWKGTRLGLPPECRGMQLTDAISHTEFHNDEASGDVAAIFGELPIALLVPARLATNRDP